MNDQNDLIFIEGLPGSGKTTFAKRLHHSLQEKSLAPLLFREGDYNPLSLLWQAIFQEKDFEELIKRYATLKKSILENTFDYGLKKAIAYTKVVAQSGDMKFYQEMQAYEVNKQKYDVFVREYDRLYEGFTKKEHPYIFECTLLQNHVNQLFAVYVKDEQTIIEHIKKLLSHLSSYKPLIFYVKQKDIPKTLERIARERISPNKELQADWIDMAINYVEQTKYGQGQSKKGKALLLQYLQDRQALELKILKELDVGVHIFELDQDYDLVFEKMEEVFR